MRVFLTVVAIFFVVADVALFLIFAVATLWLWTFNAAQYWREEKGVRQAALKLKELKDDTNLAAMADLMGIEYPDKFVSDTEASPMVQLLRLSNKQLWEDLRKLEEDVEDNVLIEQLFAERAYLKKRIQKLERKV